MKYALTPERILVTLVLLTTSAGCGQPTGGASTDAETTTRTAPAAESAAETAAGESAELVLAGGCFWCMEAAFEQLTGVTNVVSGYAGGTKETAVYETVCAGLTKHAEAIRITYDPRVIDRSTLLDVFFKGAHDPTQINRQYPDVGRQYRSAIFYADDEEKQAAKEVIDELNQSGEFDQPIATTLEPLEEFFLAEDYHQDYARLNPGQPYVVAHSLPKAAKVRKLYPELIRE